MVLLACVLAPEGDPVWPSGTAHSSHSVLSCSWAVLHCPALLREELGGGWLRIGTQGESGQLPRHGGGPGSPPPHGDSLLWLTGQPLCGFTAIVRAPGSWGICWPVPGPGRAVEGRRRPCRAGLGWLLQAVLQPQTEPGHLLLQLADGLVSPCPGEEGGDGLCRSVGQSGSCRGRGGGWADSCAGRTLFRSPLPPLQLQARDSHLSFQRPLQREVRCPLSERAVSAGRVPLGSAPGYAGFRGFSGDRKTPGLGVGGCISGHRGSEGLG